MTPYRVSRGYDGLQPLNLRPQVAYEHHIGVLGENGGHVLLGTDN